MSLPGELERRDSRLRLFFEEGFPNRTAITKQIRESADRRAVRTAVARRRPRRRMAAGGGSQDRRRHPPDTPQTSAAGRAGTHPPRSGRDGHRRLHFCDEDGQTPEHRQLTLARDRRVGGAGQQQSASARPAAAPGGHNPTLAAAHFASILYAIGEDPGVVMDEMGHTDPALALRVYRQSMRRGDEEKAALRALVEGRHA